jgi:hypothetical protein
MPAGALAGTPGIAMPFTPDWYVTPAEQFNGQADMIGISPE